MKILITTAIVLLLSRWAVAQWGYVNPPETFYGGNYVIDHNGELYHANNRDIHKTSDEGNNWTNLTQGFVTNAGNSNLMIQFAGNNIFVASTLLAVFMSPDNGSTWQMDTTGLGASYNASLLYTDGTNIFGSMDWPTYGLYMKAAAPGPWTRVNSNSIGTSYQTHVLGMTKIGNVLYASTRSSGVYESSDNGATWTQKGNANYPSPVEGQNSNRLVALGSELFVASSNGVHKSMDGGDNWTRIDQGFATWNQFNVTPIWCLYTDGTNLYASVDHDDSAYVSTDGGNTWNDISDGLKHRIKSFAVHNGKLYAAQWDTDSSVIRRDIPVGIDDEKAINPHQFSLSQNYPNPFNPSTTISYTLQNTSHITLKVFDVLGQEVVALVNKKKSAGKHTERFDGTNLNSGIYFYQLKGADFIQTRKMMLIK